MPDHSKTDNNWDMTVLARYTPDATRDIEFGFAHKTRSPNLHERYTWSTWQMAALMVNWVGDGNGYIGNLDLKPEKANTLSATFDWHAADRSLGIQGHALLHPCHRLHRRDPVECHDQRAAARRCRRTSSRCSSS